MLGVVFKRKQVGMLARSPSPSPIFIYILISSSYMQDGPGRVFIGQRVEQALPGVMSILFRVWNPEFSRSLLASFQAIQIRS